MIIFRKLYVGNGFKKRINNLIIQSIIFKYQTTTGATIVMVHTIVDK